MLKKLRIAALLALFFLSDVCLASEPIRPDHISPHHISISDQRYYRVVTEYTLHNEEEKPAKDVELKLYFPTGDTPYSKLISSIPSVRPASYQLDNMGNKRGVFVFEEIKPQAKIIITLTTLYKVGAPFYHIDPARVSREENYPDELAWYLRPSAKVESDHPLIIERARKVVGNEKNPFLKAKRIFTFLYDYMRYAKAQADPAHKGALAALRTGVGVCENYASLMVALLRASGVPARTVAGWMGKVEYNKPLTIATDDYYLSGHMWVEYYLPPYGWIAADPTYISQAGQTRKVDYTMLTGFRELRFVENEAGNSLNYEITFREANNIRVRQKKTISAFPAEKIPSATGSAEIILGQAPFLCLQTGTLLYVTPNPILTRAALWHPCAAFLSITGQ